MVFIPDVLYITLPKFIPPFKMQKAHRESPQWALLQIVIVISFLKT